MNGNYVDVVRGDAGTVVWDQNHAEAMRRLRHADAFVVFTWADLGDAQAEVSMLAKDGGSLVLTAMIMVAARALADAAGEVASFAKGEAFDG
jgi:hypothetical protein